MLPCLPMCLLQRVQSQIIAWLLFFLVQKIAPVIILSCFRIFFGIHISQKIYSVSEMTVEGYTAAIY